MHREVKDKCTSQFLHTRKASVTFLYNNQTGHKRPQYKEPNQMAKIIMQEQQKSTITTLPVGTYQSVISAAWDLGLQEGTFENVTTIKHKILFRFEINETIPDEGAFQGKRYCIFKEINVPDFFGDKAALVKLVNAVEAKQVEKAYFTDFDTDSLIGKNIMVATDLTTGGNAKIVSYGPLMKVLPPIEVELGTEAPEWVIKKQGMAIQPEDLEKAETNASAASGPAPEDSLPF